MKNNNVVFNSFNVENEIELYLVSTEFYFNWKIDDLISKLMLFTESDLSFINKQRSKNNLSTFDSLEDLKNFFLPNLHIAKNYTKEMNFELLCEIVNNGVN